MWVIFDPVHKSSLKFTSRLEQFSANLGDSWGILWVITDVRDETEYPQWDKKTRKSIDPKIK